MTHRFPYIRLFLTLLATGCGQGQQAAQSQADFDVFFQVDHGAVDGADGLAADAVDAAPHDGEYGDDGAKAGETIAEESGAGDGDVVATPDDGAAEEIVGTACEFPANPQSGEAGAACSTDDDCNNALCITAAPGSNSAKICTRTCTDCCPTGYACENYGKTGGLVLACVPKALTLCDPCISDAECNVGNYTGNSGATSALCVKYGDVGSFCGDSCNSDGDCPSGYGCQTAQGEKGAGLQCVRKSGECSCSVSAIAASAKTNCTMTNSFGVCSGVRKCTSLGLTPCPALVPESESCDGADNNCNGVIDEIGASGCSTFFPDSDGDGQGAIGSSGQCQCAASGLYSAISPTDCDDKAVSVFSGATETCDGLDNNCNGSTDEGCDDDGDGWCDSGMIVSGLPAICVKGSGDCDDGNASIHPGQVDTCGNGIDDDCDGLTDSGANISACVPFYKDVDGDGFGSGTSICSCGGEALYTAVKTGDCDDGDSAVSPSAKEVCGNGKDDNCNGVQDETGSVNCTIFFADNDSDGFGSGTGVCLCAADKVHKVQKSGDCDDGAAGISPAATETCNGKDDDCDGETDESGASGCSVWFADADADGYGAGAGVCQCGKSADFSASGAGDCNDGDAGIHPNASETCNGKDDNCDGSTDPVNAEGCKKFYADGDGDGFGKSAVSACLCAADVTYTATFGDDCNDGDANVNPNADEYCDGADNNCDGVTDEPGAADCTVYYADADGDGYGSKSIKCLCEKSGNYTATVSGDCNDADKGIHPKATETCDGIDNDCDGLTDPVNADGCNNWYVDSDGDGFGNIALPSKCLCEGGVGFSVVGGDCNDSASGVNPNADEVCNGVDDDCNGTTDPLSASGCTIFYSDGDGDGYGAANAVECACAADGLYSALVAGDCNDSASGVNPGMTEICNNVDDNCNGQTDEDLNKNYYVDQDGDGWGVGVGEFSCGPTVGHSASKSGDCDDTAATTYPGAQELCNNLDDNCNGQTDEGANLGKWYLDVDGDGFGTGGGQIQCGAGGQYTAIVGGDCNDSKAGVNPGASETCNLVDDNCNGQTDEGLPTGNYYPDSDGDGYGTNVQYASCGVGAGFSTLNGDCNDGDTAIHPGAVEICDGKDNNCVGGIDEGLSTKTYYLDSDGDGWGVGSGSVQCGPSGVSSATQSGDCDDGKASIHPGVTELCNSVDDNCDGQTDEGCATAVCTPHVIENFESGSALGWSLGYGWNVASWAAHDGAYGLGFGDGNSYPDAGFEFSPSASLDATVDVVVPQLATSLELDFYVSPDIWEICSYDHFRVYVDGKNYQNVGGCSPLAYHWVHYSLTGFGSNDWGKSVNLRFAVFSDGYDNNGFYRVDNLKWTCK